MYHNNTFGNNRIHTTRVRRQTRNLTKFDVFSLGVVIIHIMAGRKQYYDHVDNPTKIIELATNLQSREALGHNQYTNSVSMGVHGNATGFDSMKGIDQGKESLMLVHMDYVHMSDDYIMRDLASRAIGGHSSRAISEPQVVTKTTEVDNLGDGHHRRNSHLRAEGNIHTPVTMDTIGDLFRWSRSTVSSQ